MMKHIWLITLITLILCLHQLPAQVRVNGATSQPAYGAPFLGLNNDPAGGGMAEIGVVATAYNYQSAAQANPALLARNQAVTGVNVAYTPWLRALGFPGIYIGDVNVYHSKNRLGLGLNVRRFSLGEIFAYDLPYYGEKYAEVRLGAHAAYQLSDHLSVGLGLQLFQSDLPPVLVRSYTRVRSAALNAGLHYQNQKTLSNGKLWYYRVGLALTHLGLNVDYQQVNGTESSLPSNLSLGTLQGLQYRLAEVWTLHYELALQTQKSLAQGSGGSRPVEQLQSVNVQLGGEVRLSGKQQSLIAIRTGRFFEHRDFGNRNFYTAGLGLGIKGIRLDVSYLIPQQRNHPLQNTFRLGLCYQKMLSD